MCAAIEAGNPAVLLLRGGICSQVTGGRKDRAGCAAMEAALREMKKFSRKIHTPANTL